MSEPAVAAGGVDAALAAAPMQAGAILRAAREAQGLHIAALAVALKVPVRKLEALEASRYDELPDTVFVRSLAMSVCRALKIRPEQILAALPGVPAASIKAAGTGLNTEFKTADSATHRSLRAQLTRPLGLGAVALLLATAGILLWPDKSVISAGDATGTATPPVSEPSPQTLPVLAVPAVQPQPVVGDTHAVGEEGTAVAPHVLEIKANGVSWIEVTDADGTPRLRQLTAQGEVLRVSGKLPLAVVVGRADQISVQVRGQRLDLAPLARDNVARFEVK